MSGSGEAAQVQLLAFAAPAAADGCALGAAAAIPDVSLSGWCNITGSGTFTKCVVTRDVPAGQYGSRRLLYGKAAVEQHQCQLAVGKSANQ